MSARTRNPDAKREPIVLTDLEQIAIEGLMVQEAQLQRELAIAMEPITRKYLSVFAMIEDRIDLEPCALQTTHTIDAQTMTVRERDILPVHAVDSERIKN